MTPSHHPGDDVLLAYAAGTCEEPVSLLLATHLALCPRCRAEVARLEALGGALLASSASAAESAADTGLDRVLARLEDVEIIDAPTPTPAPAEPRPVVPEPLRSYLGGPLSALKWKWFGSLAEATLLADNKGFRTRLLRVKPGAATPRHSHGGQEWALVLAGGFSDERGHFLRGDVAEADPSVDHHPVADLGEECISLLVNEGGLKLTGPKGRLLNPLLGN